MFRVCFFGPSWAALSLYSHPDRRFCLSTVQPSVLLCSECRENSMTLQIHLSAAEHDHSASPSFPSTLSLSSFLSFSTILLLLFFLLFFTFFLMVYIKPKISRGRNQSSVCGLASKPNGHWLALLFGGNRSNMCRLWNLGQVNKSLWGFSGIFLWSCTALDLEGLVVS